MNVLNILNIPFFRQFFLCFTAAYFPIVIPGSVQVGGLSLRQLALQDVVLVQPEHLGGRVVFKAKSVSLHPSWNILQGNPL